MKEILTQVLFLLIPMDSAQTDHLKAYGVVYQSLQHQTQVEWLLNYRGGSYLVVDNEENREALAKNNVAYQPLDRSEAKTLEGKISDDNMQAIVQLERAPKVAVYAPSDKENWDDAVMNVLNYSGIPYDVINDFDVLNKDLSKYDWIHLHHEDFTGQFGRYHAYSTQPWYTAMVAAEQAEAKKLGYSKVSQLKLAVAKKLKAYVNNGGYLFAMCSATDSYDIALAADGTDIVPAEFDGDPVAADFKSHLNFKNSFAFENYRIDTTASNYEFSSIDTYNWRGRAIYERNDYFDLQSYSGKTNPQQAMFTQNHVQHIKGFWGMTTGFSPAYIKDNVAIMGRTTIGIDEARYISGTFGKGSWCYYSGHDPEDYMHRVGETAPDLSLTPNSPGSRLILNNVLRPAAVIPSSEQDQALDMNVHNNPVRSSELRLGISVNQPETQDMKGTVRIFDMQGREIRTFEVTMENGENTVSFDIPEMSTGLYYAQLQVGKKLIQRKFVVEK